MNGRLLSHRRTKRLERWSNAAKVLWMRLHGSPPPVRLGLLLMLLALVTLFAGCATPSPPDAWPKNPQPPQLTEPIDSQSYLSKAQKLIESWQRAVTGM